MRTLFSRVAMLSIAAAAGSAAPADVVFETPDPFGGPFGLWGADVSSEQRVAARFTPDRDYDLSSVAIWFMSNDFAGGHPAVTVSLRAGEDIPSDLVTYEAWTYDISAVGWSPVLETSTSTLHPRLVGGLHYWVVAESSAPGGDDPVWNFASSGNEYTATDNRNAGWAGGSGAALTLIVQATSACPCETDGTPGVGIFDLLDYLGGWFALDRQSERTGDSPARIDIFDLLAYLDCWFAASAGAPCP